MLCLYKLVYSQKRRKGMVYGPRYAGVYIFLFITLQSEDWALLIGSVGVFAITALLMFITRKLISLKTGRPENNGSPPALICCLTVHCRPGVSAGACF